MSRYDTRVTNRPYRTDEGWMYDPSLADPYGPGYDPGLATNPYGEPAQSPADTPWGSVDANGAEWGRGVRNEYKLPSPEDDVQTARALSRTDSTWASDALPLAERPPAQETGELEQESFAEESESSEETLPVEQKPDYTDVSARVSTTPGKGARPDPFGRDDETMTRDERMRLAAEAYDAAETGGDEGRWEDEYTRYHTRPTDDDVDRSWQLQSLMWGNDQGMKFREMMRKEQAGYEQGLEGARGKDYAGRRISKALAQSIVAARLATPEEAATLTHGDELVKTFTSGAYSQGSRAEALEQKYQTHMTDTDRKIAELEARERMAAESRASQEKIAETYAKRPKSGGGEKLSPQGMTNVIAKNLFEKAEGKLTAAQARAAAAGDFSSIPANMRDQVELDVAALREFDDRASARPLAPNVSGEQAKGPTRVATAANIDRAKLPTRTDSLAYKRQLIDLAEALKPAIAAWNRIKKDPEAAAAWVQVGPKGPEAIKGAAGLKNYQAEATRLYNLRNVLILAASGKAVTDHELQAQLEAAGMNANYFDPYKDASGYQAFIDRIKGTVQTRRKSMAADGSWPYAAQE